MPLSWARPRTYLAYGTVSFYITENTARAGGHGKVRANFRLLGTFSIVRTSVESKNCLVFPRVATTPRTERKISTCERANNTRLQEVLRQLVTWATVLYRLEAEGREGITSIYKSIYIKSWRNDISRTEVDNVKRYMILFRKSGW